MSVKSRSLELTKVGFLPLEAVICGGGAGFLWPEAEEETTAALLPLVLALLPCWDVDEEEEVEVTEEAAAVVLLLLRPLPRFMDWTRSARSEARLEARLTTSGSSSEKRAKHDHFIAS